MESTPFVPKKGKRLAAFALPVSAAALALLFYLLPSIPSVFPILCPLYATTGIYCATCGATRATHALLHGDLVSAFDFNPLYIALLPLFAYLAVAGYLRLLPVRIRLPLPNAWLRILAWSALPLTVYTVLRNLPWPAFTWLAP